MRWADFVLATLFALGISAYFAPVWAGLLLVVMVTTHMLAWRMCRSLGGLTGDTYGALSEMGEVVVLLAMVAVYKHWGTLQKLLLN